MIIMKLYKNFDEKRLESQNNLYEALIKNFDEKKTRVTK